MGLPVLIIGRSGTGKSASLRNFKKEEIFAINVIGKPLPFRNDLTIYGSDDYIKIKNALVKSPYESIVIDDSGYLMTNQFMRGHSSTGKGNAVFELYNTIGDNFWDLIQFSKKLPDNKIVYFVMHEEQNDFGNIKPKSIGKMLDDKVCIEGLFTIVLRSSLENGKYVFKTQTDGLDVAKTPIGMFENTEIDNDLSIVDKTIREYYRIGEEINDTI